MTNDGVIEKITLKQLVSSNVNKESLCIYFASHILECKKDSLKTYVVTLKHECKSNKLSVELLTSTQEEADTCMLLHATDTTEKGATSLSIHSSDTDVLVLALWKFASLCDETSVVVGTGDKRQFHCVLHTTRLEVNLWQYCQDSTHSLDVIKRVPYVESLKSRAGIL